VVALFRLNQSHEMLQKELMSKTAAERALSKTLELQVATLEKNVKQKVAQLSALISSSINIE